MIEEIKCIEIIIPQYVYVRKNDVDTYELARMLRKHKAIPITTIAEHLNVPKTEVEHWFRTDKYQSIPSANLWISLKSLLGITDNSFDDAITQFEYKLNVFEKGNRCYDINGLSPTLVCGDGGGVKILWNMNK